MRKHRSFDDERSGRSEMPGQGFGRRGGGWGPGPGHGPAGVFGGLGPGAFGLGPGRPGRPGPEGHEGFEGFEGGPRRRGRGRRGDVRKGILAILRDGPANGYQVMEGIAEKSQGLWRPSPGSVYPALAMLEDEGVVEAVQVDGRKAFALTEAGAAQVAEQAQELENLFTSVTDSGEGLLDVRSEVGQLAMTLGQLARAGTPQQREQAKQVLVRARQDLHRIMAGDPVSQA